MIQGEGAPRFTGNRAHRPYARCLHPVCTVLGRHLHRGRKAATGLHPVSPMNKAVKQKRWSRWREGKIYRKGILKNKKHSPEKRCYIFFWNLHIFPLKPVTSFFERCYVFLKKMLRLFKQTGGTDVYGFGLMLSQPVFLRLLRLLYYLFIQFIHSSVYKRLLFRHHQMTFQSADSLIGKISDTFAIFLQDFEILIQCNGFINYYN